MRLSNRYQTLAIRIHRLKSWNQWRHSRLLICPFGRWTELFLQFLFLLFPFHLQIRILTLVPLLRSNRLTPLSPHNLFPQYQRGLILSSRFYIINKVLIIPNKVPFSRQTSSITKSYRHSLSNWLNHRHLMRRRFRSSWDTLSSCMFRFLVRSFYWGINRPYLLLVGREKRDLRF